MERVINAALVSPEFYLTRNEETRQKMETFEGGCGTSPREEMTER